MTLTDMFYAGLLLFVVLFVMSLVIVDEIKHAAKCRRRK